MMNRKTQWQMLAMATLVAGLGWIGTAQAELLVYEGFDYEAGSNVVGQTGGDGWEDPWVLTGGTSSPTTGATTLSYGLLQTTGGAADWTGSDRTKITRNTDDLSDYYDVGDTLYASFLASNTGSYEYKYFFGDLAGSDGIGWSIPHKSGIEFILIIPATALFCHLRRTCFTGHPVSGHACHIAVLSLHNRRQHTGNQLCTALCNNLSFH